VTTTPLRVASWNILGRRVAETHQPADEGSVRSVIQDLNIHILCLQEVHFYGGEPDRQLLDELHAAGLRHFVGLPLSASHLDSSAQLGVGVASVWPLVRRDALVFSAPDVKARVRGEDWVLHDKGMVGCDIEIPGRPPVRIYSLHLFPFHEFGIKDGDARIAEMWNEFWQHADERADGRRTILAGDFNQQDTKDAATKWSKADWSFCFTNVRTTSTGLALDEIALTQPGAAVSRKVISNFSDHHIVVAELDVV
jgi:endonuclease/exonuclease/phosphatase family metal-dependent hydrolase